MNQDHNELLNDPFEFIDQCREQLNSWRFNSLPMHDKIEMINLWENDMKNLYIRMENANENLIILRAFQEEAKQLFIDAKAALLDEDAYDYFEF